MPTGCIEKPSCTPPDLPIRGLKGNYGEDAAVIAGADQ